MMVRRDVTRGIVRSNVFDVRNTSRSAIECLIINLEFNWIVRRRIIDLSKSFGRFDALFENSE